MEIEARSRMSCFHRWVCQPLPPLFFSCFFFAWYSLHRFENKTLNSSIHSLHSSSMPVFGKKAGQKEAAQQSNNQVRVPNAPALTSISQAPLGIPQQHGYPVRRA